MLTKEQARLILKIYKEAWVEQNTEKILSIFAKNGTYQEKAFEKPLKGHKRIKDYWQTKVVKEQSNIKFKLLKYYIDKNNLIAEWDASFFSNIKKKRIHIKEVAIMQISKGKIKSLREYWHSKIISF